MGWPGGTGEVGGLRSLHCSFADRKFESQLKNFIVTLRPSLPSFSKEKVQYLSVIVMSNKMSEKQQFLNISLIIILAICFTVMGIPALSQIIVSDFKVNQNTGPTVGDQWDPELGSDSLGNFKITWLDYSPDQGRICGQLYTAAGLAIGENFLIYPDSSDIKQTWSDMAVNSAGDFVIVWVGARDLDRNLYMRIFRADGTPAGDVIQVNDDTTDARQYFPEVAINSHGYIVIAWNDSRDNSQNIYGQRFTPNGISAGNNFRVFEGPDHPAEGECAVAIDDSGRFIITAVDDYYFDLIGQRFNQDGERLGDLFTVNDTELVNGASYPAIDAERSGGFIITWVDLRNDYINIYIQRYRDDGAPLDSNLRVTQNTDNNWIFDPEISINENGNFIISWEDYDGQVSDIFARLFLANGTPYDISFQVPANAGSDQKAPSIKMVGNHIYSAWMDNRGSSSHFDIWSNIRQWDNPLIIRETSDFFNPDGFVLYQNYPNPFNSRTKVTYYLYRSAVVNLSIYDISGAEIIRLVNKYQKAGRHEVVFEAPALASGIYICRLQSGDRIQSRKMFLIK